MFYFGCLPGGPLLKHKGNDQIIFIIPASEFTVLQTLFPALLLGSKMSPRRTCHQMQGLFLCCWEDITQGLQKLPGCSNTNVTNCGLLFTAFLI